MSHVCVTIVVPSAVILVLSYNYISHASSMCSPKPLLCPTVYVLRWVLWGLLLLPWNRVYILMGSICPSTYAWGSIIQSSSVVIPVRVHTSDQMPRSMYAWGSIIQSSSVVTPVWVHTSDQMPWSMYASWLVLSCRYTSFYILFKHLLILMLLWSWLKSLDWCSCEVFRLTALTLMASVV
jgi:hypothetical protein